MDYLDSIYWVFKQLRKHLLYANSKKSQFYLHKVRFFDYVLSLQKIDIENKQIETIKD